MTDVKRCVGFTFSLSSGILSEIDVECYANGTACGLDYHGRATWTAGSFKVGKDLFLTLEEAKAAAEEARIKELGRLHRRISKLENMKFSVVGCKQGEMT